MYIILLNGADNDWFIDYQQIIYRKKMKNKRIDYRIISI